MFWRHFSRIYLITTAGISGVYGLNSFSKMARKSLTKFEINSYIDVFGLCCAFFGTVVLASVVTFMYGIAGPILVPLYTGHKLMSKYKNKKLTYD